MSSSAGGRENRRSSLVGSLRHGTGVSGVFCGVALAIVLAPAAARAEPPTQPDADTYSVHARSATYLQLYQRALLPGPGGAIVATTTPAPATEYVSLRADDIDAPWKKDSLDFELSAWGDALMGEAGQTDRRIDGDLQTANVRYRAGPGWVRLGRQVYAGGAARFSRFDGLSGGGKLSMGLGGELYGGLSVLPRWDARPGYYQLGSASDTLLRDPRALPEPSRSGYWLAGGRIFYDKGPVIAGLSMHEQHDGGELARRNLGADLRLTPFDKASLGGTALLDLDSAGLADGRVWIDSTPLEHVTLGGEFLHTEPALFLSRQSVLSVFSTDKFDELGSTASWQLDKLVGLEGGGYIELYSDGSKGVRGKIAIKLTPDRDGNTLLRLGYTRVRAVDNGYHSVRNSLRQRIARTLAATAEAYLYVYDQAIRGYNVSSVYAGTLEWDPRSDLGLLWGASFADSPYARADVQTLLRLVYNFNREAP